ncbi:hypothetical protein PHMEG_00014406 [Phytophthora megakarya]|uniref:Uncharacterized protein n=1 Tax=Phytophthora megakarya TaxID=4795 RepID=A0A225W5Y6_9STRA|nr:hypothetical protein PHMEG_00014406 [Phytophthora megakarya]
MKKYVGIRSSYLVGRVCRMYLPKKLVSRTGEVRTRSDLYKLKRSLLATENEEDPSAGSEVGVADSRSVVCSTTL